MKRIAIVTSTRAEFGLLTPLIQQIYEDNELDLDLIVTGTHLSEKHGYTIDEVYGSGFPISHKIPILKWDNSSYGVSLTMANAIKGFADCFQKDRPDMVVILGDRTEMLSVASVAMNELIPIAHIHGGEITEGAVDDCVRHAITKMSYLHFTCAEPYRNRVIQLGENPERVYNVGSLGTENILHQKLLTRVELGEQIDYLLDIEKLFAVATFHPVTLDREQVDIQVKELCAAMESCSDIFFLITATNADAGGVRANELLLQYCSSHLNAGFVENLGMKRYLSAVKNAVFVVGNSSSGILEAPVLGTPTVNIGDRQKGRLRAETVIDCRTKCEDISISMQKARTMEHRQSFLFGDGKTSERIIKALKESFAMGIDLKKGFYDIK